MKHHEIFILGLSLFNEVSLNDFSHEELWEMVAGRVLKALHADPTLGSFSRDELRQSAERVASLCLVLALAPQKVKIPDF